MNKDLPEENSDAWDESAQENSSDCMSPDELEDFNRDMGLLDPVEQ